MAQIKEFFTRIMQKHDTESNWDNATDFIPLKGEIIVYDKDDTNTVPKIKIGDGIYNETTKEVEGTTISNLPFITDPFLKTIGGNLSGHLYLTGAKETSSTSNTSQIVFGTASNNHVAISSNNNAIVINPTIASTAGQIVLYLDKPSVFPKGISGNASTATALTSSAGSATQPVYFSGGKPVATTYTLGKSVPSDAKFTDTTYTFNGAVSTIKDSNLTANRALVSDANGKVAVSAVTSTELGYLDGVTSAIQTQINNKLQKLPYEWNKSYNAGGTAGYLLIGSFPMYDSNVTIDIDSTTSTTYHGTVVIATQNVSETSIGSAHTITVYGDPTGAISDAIRVVWTSGSRNYNVYFVPSTWSKNLIHIRALGNYLENIDESKICTQFTTGTAPATTSGLTVVNALRTNFNNYTLPTATSSTLGGVKVGSNISVSSGTISLSKANVTAALGYTPPTTDTTYNVATTSANGLMSSTDKTNLNTAVTHVSNTSNPHSVTKSQVGLGNVTNDKQMPIAGGTFTGNAIAYSTNRNSACLRNIVVQNSSGTAQSTNYIIGVRK